MEEKVDYSKMSAEEIAARFKGEPFSDFDEALAWLHCRNPNMENNHPENLDWQALKASWRRF
jgi:hypothetical protein